MGETMRLYVVEYGWDKDIVLVTNSLDAAIAKRDEDENSQIRFGELNVPGDFNVLMHDYYIVSFHTIQGVFSTSKNTTTNFCSINLDVPGYYLWENKIYVSVFVENTPDATFKAENKAIQLIGDWLKARAHKIPEVYNLFQIATGGMVGRPDFLTDDYGRIHQVCM